MHEHMEQNDEADRPKKTSFLGVEIGIRPSAETSLQEIGRVLGAIGTTMEQLLQVQREILYNLEGLKSERRR